MSRREANRAFYMNDLEALFDGLTLPQMEAIMLVIQRMHPEAPDIMLTSQDCQQKFDVDRKGIKGHIDEVMRRKGIDFGCERLVMALEEAYAREDNPLPRDDGKELKRWLSTERAFWNKELRSARKKLAKDKKEANQKKAKENRAASMLEKRLKRQEEEGQEERDEYDMADNEFDALAAGDGEEWVRPPDAGHEGAGGGRGKRQKKPKKHE